MVIVLALVGLATNQISFKNLAFADSSRIVRVFADGKDKTFSTEAATVGEALERLGLELSADDLVEPGLSTQLQHGFYNVNVYRAQPYRITEGGRSRTLQSAHRSVRQVVEAAGIKLYPEDEVSAVVARDFVATPIIGHNVTIKRAAAVALNADGRVVTLRTHAKTVKEMFETKQVALGEQDQVTPGLDAAITPGLSVVVTRISQAVVTKTEAVARDVKTVFDSDLLAGTRKVQAEGRDGRRLVTYRIVYHNGQEQSRTTLKTEEQERPVARVVAVGIKVVAAAASDDVWYRLRLCESGNVYSRNTGNGYYGAYQFDIGTWGGYGGYRLASDAPPHLQDAKAQATQAARGWGPWPACAQKLGLL